MVNYYAELDIDRGLDLEGIKKALSGLRRKWQGRANSASEPEDQRKAEDMMQLIREASQILQNKEEREKYDKKLDKDPVLSGQQASSAPVDNPSQYAQAEMYTSEMLDALDATYRDSKYNTAVLLAKKLIKSMDDCPINVYRILACCYAEMGRQDEAALTVHDMVEAKPEDIEAHYLAAFFYLRLIEGRASDARKYIDWLLQSSEGASGRVAALDVEYYIDTGDLALADAKTEEYKKTVGTSRDFTKSIGTAYRQYAESFYTDYGGDYYFSKKEDYENWKKYNQLALSIYPDASEQSRYAENLKLLSGITFEKGNAFGIFSAFILALLFAGSGGSLTGLSVLCFAAFLYITVFSFVPKWMDHRANYTGKLDVQYSIAHWGAYGIGFVVKLIYNIVKGIIGLILDFISAL